jgi:hypothetical protein
MALLSFIKHLVSDKEGVKEYRETLARALRDTKITDEESAELDAVSKKYGLTIEEVRRLQKAALSNVFTSMASDQRITEEERDSLETLLHHFGLSPRDIDFDQKAFNKYHSLALIEKGVLPEIREGHHDIHIILKKGEVLHFGAESVLRKLNRVTHRVNCRGLTSSIRITRGMRYRVGSIKYNTVSKEVLAAEDTGAFYITNKRLGYIGVRKQFSVLFNKVSTIELRQDGLYIFKAGRERPYIITLNDYEVPAAVISSILNRDTP